MNMLADDKTETLDGKIEGSLLGSMFDAFLVSVIFLEVIVIYGVRS